MSKLLDYQDRISVMSWAALFTLAAGSLMRWPEWSFTWWVLGSPITLAVDQVVITSIILAAIACSGTEAVIHSHPLALRVRLRHTWMHWGLPATILVLAEILMPAMPSRTYVVGEILLAGLLLAIAEIAIYHTLAPDDPRYRLARIALNAVAYTVALVLFLLVYRTRVRSLLSATLIASVSALLALELLRGLSERVSDIILYAAITGAILGEATWALNYWRTTSYIAGLLLLLLFYLIVGLGQHALLRRLTKRVLFEYATIAAIGVLFIGWLAS
ncbi:MAG TPA: hypothetical protein G4O02_12010 [Caldilineae bacterium]|nr:hypothetical protein [Caldilineae bacterium]